MPALFFPHPNALRLTLASGLVPTEITQNPTTAGVDPNGRLWIDLAELPARDSLAALARLGVQTLGGSGVPTQPINCWAELLPLQSAPPTVERLLFLVPERQLARFVARLRRGASLVGVGLPSCGPPGMGWVIAQHPPAGLLAEIAEPDSPIETYHEAAPRVWVRRGWQHPLPEQLVVPAGQIALLSPPRSVLTTPDALPDAEPDELRLRPVHHSQTTPPPAAPPVPVRLTLTPRREPARPSLWVLNPAEARDFWGFCSGSDSRPIEKLEAAAIESGPDSGLVVRATGKRLPFLPLRSWGFAADSRIEGLFLPADKRLRPSLRPGDLARILGTGAGLVVWLTSTANGDVVPHHIASSAFRPVAEWLEYQAPARAPLEVLRRSDPFPLARFVVQHEPNPISEPLPPPVAVQPDPPPVPPPQTNDPGWLRRSLRKVVARLRGNAEDTEPTVPSESRQSVVEQPHAAGRVEQKLASPDALLLGQDWAARRRELEARLFRDLPRLGPAGRAERWADLAAVYAVAGNPTDTAVCWMNAVWESPAPPRNWLEQWLAAECRAAKLLDTAGGLERWLSEPGRVGVGRVVAAYTASAGFAPSPPPEFLPALPRLLAFLDQHFDDLPVRAAWLARVAAAHVCDGDALGLARWRDRVLARLRDRGPGLDLDEPSFLRFHGTPSADRFPIAREWLVRVREQALVWVREQSQGGRLQFSGLDAEADCTAAYAQFMFAWGLGCLGERTRARDWAARSRKVVTRASGRGVEPAAHALLADLFLLRVRDAQEGRAAKPGLPTHLQSRIDALPELARFAVDRLREHSGILEPLDRVRAFRGTELKVFWGNDRLGERLYVLAERTDTAHLADEVEALLRLCVTNSTTDTVPRVVLTLLEVAPRLTPTALLRTLDLLPTAIEWMESLLITQPWREGELPRKLAEYSARMIEAGFAAAGNLPAEAIGTAVASLVRRLLTLGNSIRVALLRACGTVFRSLRRLELRGEAEAIVRFIDVPATTARPQAAEQIELAIGWYTAGDEDAGNRLLNTARDSLYLTDTPGKTARAIAYAGALGFAPPGIAHGRLEEIFQRLDRVETQGATNPYFTLKPLQLIDTVVRSVVTDERALGPAVRGWLDDDEFLIRSRIHRDLAAVLREEGIR